MPCYLLDMGQFIDPTDSNSFCCDGSKAREFVADAHEMAVAEVKELFCIADDPTFREGFCLPYKELTEFQRSCDFARTR